MPPPDPTTGWAVKSCHPAFQKMTRPFGERLSRRRLRSPPLNVGAGFSSVVTAEWTRSTGFPNRFTPTATAIQAAATIAAPAASRAVRETVKRASSPAMRAAAPIASGTSEIILAAVCAPSVAWICRCR